jgi:hypothetical protein
VKISVSLIALIAAGLLIPSGCAGYRQGMRNAAHSVGAILPQDVEQAEACSILLPPLLELPEEDVRVRAGSGVTHVTIRNVEEPAERQRIEKHINSLNHTNFPMRPLRLKFK